MATKSADDPAFELEYAPYGVQSGLCAGVGATAAQGAKVSLQPCGVSSKTVWIADVGLVPGTPNSSVTTITYDKGSAAPAVSSPTSFARPLDRRHRSTRYLTDDPTALFHGYAPVINGSNTNFSHPFVLTYPGNGSPTDMPRPQLFVSNLTGFSNGFGPIVGTVNENQLWSAVPGVLGP